MLPGSPEFESLFRNAPIPMYLWIQSGEPFDPVLGDFNEAAMHITGGRIPDLIGKKCSEMYSNEPQIVEDFRRCFEQRKPVFRRMQYRMRSNQAVGSFRVAYIPVNDSTIVVAVVPE